MAAADPAYFICIRPLCVPHRHFRAVGRNTPLVWLCKAAKSGAAEAAPQRMRKEDEEESRSGAA